MVKEACGYIKDIVQGQLDGKTLGKYDPTTKTITIDSRKFDMRRLQLYFTDTVAH